MSQAYFYNFAMSVWFPVRGGSTTHLALKVVQLQSRRAYLCSSMVRLNSRAVLALNKLKETLEITQVYSGPPWCSGSLEALKKFMQTDPELDGTDPEQHGWTDGWMDR